MHRSKVVVTKATIECRNCEDEAVECRTRLWNAGLGCGMQTQRLWNAAGGAPLSLSWRPNGDLVGDNSDQGGDRDTATK